MTIRRKLNIGISILLILFSVLGIVIHVHIGQIDENISEIIQGKELGRSVALLYRQYKVLGEILKKNQDSRNALIIKTSDNFDRIEKIINNEIRPSLDLKEPDGLEQTQRTLQMEVSIARISEEITKCMLTSNNDYKDNIFDNADILTHEINSFKTGKLTEEQKKSVSELETVFSQTIPLVQEIFSLNDYLREKQYDYEEKKTRIDSLLGKEYEVFTETDLENAKKAGQKVVTTAVIMTLILVLTGILDLFVFSATINRTITKPIIALKNAMTETGKGHFNTKIEIDSQDEIGQLAACFNNMTEKLKQTTTSVENLNTEISKRKEAQEALQKAHYELEQRVEQRTTELAQANEELEKLNSELDLAVRDLSRSNQELQEFASIVAHDLKTPLRGIVTLADWIVSDYADKLDEQGKNQMEMLVTKAKQTSTMINDILEYSKAGRKQLEKKKVNLNTILKDLISGIDAGDNIEIIVENELPTILYDKTQIFQVFQNLLTNAVKYMDKSKGQIRISSCEEEDFWKFSVADNGPGIEKKYFNKIFRMFQTVSANNNTDSTGIGLSIVKKIVEVNNGQVWLESEQGNGCTFFFTLPKQKSFCKV